jgi:uroporphyrin-3 C-methyltransferase
MNPASIPEPAVEPVGGEAGSVLAPPVAGPTGLARGMVWAIGAVATVALAASGFIWQKVSGMQEQLARQSADAGAASVEARAMARQAMEQTRETAARQALIEARLSEVSLQRTQLEELMQSLSRSRDENLVVDIESALRLAQQQAQLTGSVDPLLAALRSADQRIRRAGQPRLTPLQRAIGRDIDRIKSATLADLPALLVKLDELVRLVDDLPVANAVGCLACRWARGSRRPRRATGLVAARPGRDWSGDSGSRARQSHRAARGGPALARAVLLAAREPQAQTAEREARLAGTPTGVGPGRSRSGVDGLEQVL